MLHEDHDSIRARRGETVVLRLPYRAPFDGEGLVAFLARRAVPGVEQVVDGAYRRSLRLRYGPGVVELRPLRGDVQARFRLEDPRDLSAAVRRCRALLDLDSDPHAVVRALGADPLLGPLVRAAPGRRVAGAVDGPELALRAVLGQQVSLAGAATLAGRLVADHGKPLSRPVGTVTHLFPSAETLAAANPATLPLPAARRRALLGLAGALARGELTLDAGLRRAGGGAERAGGGAEPAGGGPAGAGAEPGGVGAEPAGGGAERDEAKRRLLALPGIGPWTVAYVAMRALRDPDAFLPTDLGVRRALERLGRDGRPQVAAQVAESWRPYRAYAVQHLWAQLAGPSPAREEIQS